MSCMLLDINLYMYCLTVPLVVRRAAWHLSSSATRTTLKCLSISPKQVLYPPSSLRTNGCMFLKRTSSLRCSSPNKPHFSTLWSDYGRNRKKYAVPFKFFLATSYYIYKNRILTFRWCCLWLYDRPAFSLFSPMVTRFGNNLSFFFVSF